MNKKQQLMESFTDAIAVKNDYIAVAILTEGNEGTEIIINPACNFVNKQKYYDNAYNDDLILKTYSGIRIVGICSFDKDCDWDTISDMLSEPL